MKSLDLLVANLVLRTSSAAANAILQPLPKGVAPKPALRRIFEQILGSTGRQYLHRRSLRGWLLNPRREDLPMKSLDLLVANLVPNTPFVLGSCFKVPSAARASRACRVRVASRASHSIATAAP